MTNSIGSNIGSLKVGRQLDLISRDLSANYRRISSGSRITRASDDAAGLAISSSLRASIRIFSQAIRNTNDGISLLNIQESTLGQLTDVSMRLKELATQAANGSLSRIQRLSLDTEGAQLSAEFNRIIGSTTFNGRKLFAADFTSLRIQAGVGTEESLSLSANQYLRRSQGSGQFSVSYTDGSVGYTPSGAYAAADFNGDGKIDILSGGNDVPAAFRIANGNGDGTFGDSIVRGSFLGLTSLTNATTGDIDGDGDIDVAAIESGNVVGIFLNNGSGSFSLAQSFTQSGAQLKLQDLNGDGRADLVQGGGTNLRVYLANTDGTVASSPTTYTVSGAVFREAEFGDINGDGHIDIITANSGGSSALNLLLGNGQGGFSTAVSFGTAQNTSLEIRDVNHDGLLDVIAGKNTSAIEVYLGNSNATFQSAVSIGITGTSNTYLRMADFNNDGHDDIIAGTFSGSTISILLGNGTGSFALESTFAGRWQANQHIADFNNDGVTDIFYYEQSGGELNVALGGATDTNTIQRFDLTTADSARSALELIDAVLNRILKERGSLGALQARLETASKNILSRALNYEAADSRIRDIDIASESADLTRNQIRQQTASALLAQANAEPELLLSLLQSA